MLQPTGIDEQLSAVRDDPLRVLVVGAGVAGITIVGLLRGQGLHPVLLERAEPGADSGYMIALMPLVDPVLAALAATDEYVANSISLRRYRMRNRHGATIREYSMGELLHQYGDYRGISRGDLLQVLGSPGGTVTHRATVTALDQDAESVRATIHDGTTSVSAGFDLVIAADGLHSATRALALPPDQVAEYDTGWGGWVTWTDLDDDSDLGEELWGNGIFAGSYPVK
ncbi:MAG: FAD-dependent oxidoreductase, partial [Micromonosporaceae bacterium]